MSEPRTFYRKDTGVEITIPGAKFNPDVHCETPPKEIAKDAPTEVAPESVEAPKPKARKAKKAK